MHTFDTGDLLLFHKARGLHIFGSLIQWATDSPFSHIGMVIRDPTFIHPALTGAFLWQSTRTTVPDAASGKHVFGVQLTPLHECLKANPDYQFSSRSVLRGRGLFSPHKLADIFERTYSKPYDIVPRDWLHALVHTEAVPPTPDRFWCSALVAYILTQLGGLPPDTDWGLIRPVDLSSSAPVQLPWVDVGYGVDRRL